MQTQQLRNADSLIQLHRLVTHSAGRHVIPARPVDWPTVDIQNSQLQSLETSTPILAVEKIEHNAPECFAEKTQLGQMNGGMGQDAGNDSTREGHA